MSISRILNKTNRETGKCLRETHSTPISEGPYRGVSIGGNLREIFAEKKLEVPQEMRLKLLILAASSGKA